MKGLRPFLARVMLAGAAAACALPSPASAQAPTQAASLAHAGPNGLKVGEGRLHPFVDLEPRLDTAAGFFPRGPNLANEPSPEVVLHLRPGVRFELPSDAVAVDFTGAVEYLYYTGLLTPGSYLASRLEGAAGLNLAINRQGAIQFNLGDDFTYSDKTRNLALSVGAVSLFNEARAQLDIRPGGGALEISPRASYALEQFRALADRLPAGCNAGDTCDPARVPEMSYQNIRGGLDARWKFLPKTAIVLESNFDSRLYNNPDPTVNPPSLLLRAVGGLQGLLTTKIAVVAKAGWAYDFAVAPNAPPGSNASTFLAHVEGAYLLTEASNFRAGYYRSVEPVPAFKTVQDDRVYGEARMLFSGRLVLRVYGAVDFISFGPTAARQALAVTANPGVEYQVFPWLYTAAGYTLSLRSSLGTSPSSTDNYTRHEAYLRITAAY